MTRYPSGKDPEGIAAQGEAGLAGLRSTRLPFHAQRRRAERAGGRRSEIRGGRPAVAAGHWCPAAISRLGTPGKDVIAGAWRQVRASVRGGDVFKDLAGRRLVAR
jgi:hypothetical protein